MSLAFGWLMFVSGIFVPELSQPKTLFFGFSRLSVGLMLGAAIALLVSSVVASRLIRRQP
jgi:hypothetical protein